MQRHPHLCEPRDLYLAECSECEILEQNIEDLDNKVEQYNTEVRNTLNNHNTRINTNATNITTLQTTKQDKLIAGSNITISGNTISAKDTTYSNATQSVAGLMSPDDKKKLDNLINTIHPVGDTIIRLDNTNPGTLYPGTTWEKVSVGRMLIGADSTYTLGSTGGSANAVVVNHNHTQNAHNHTQNSHNHTQNTHNHTAGVYSDGTAARFLKVRENVDIVVASKLTEPATTSSGAYRVYSTTKGIEGGISQNTGVEHTTATNIAATATNIAATATNNPAGVDGTGKNMPPYLAVNIWRRTA